LWRDRNKIFDRLCFFNGKLEEPKSEVDALMSLLLDYLKNAETHIGGKDVRIQVIGDTSVFDDEIKKRN